MIVLSAPLPALAGKNNFFLPLPVRRRYSCAYLIDPFDCAPSFAKATEGRQGDQKNKFYLTPKVGKSIIAREICDSIQYIMSDIKRAQSSTKTYYTSTALFRCAGGFRCARGGQSIVLKRAH